MTAEHTAAQSSLSMAKMSAGQAEAELSALAADQPNTMTAIRLLYATTICALAVTNLQSASDVLRNVQQQHHRR